MGVNEETDKRAIEISTGVSLQPSGPVEFKFNSGYKGRKLSLNILPNEVKIVNYGRYTLMVRYYVNENGNVLKWATLDKHGELIEVGEI